MKTLKCLLIVMLWMSMQNVRSQNPDIALRAFELRMNGHPYEALALLDSALELYPDSSRLWFEKGRCLDWIKTDGCDKFIHVYTKMSPRIRISGKCFRQACRLDSDNARCYYWAASNGAISSLTAIYTPWKWPLIPCKFRKTARDAGKAVLYAPANPEYRFALIEYSRFGWVLSGSKKRFQLHLDTLEMLDPVYAVKAREMLAGSKHPYDALAGYKALEPTYPEHPVLLDGLTREYAKLIRHDSAYIDTVMGYFIKLIATDPSNPVSLNRFTRFLIRYEAGDPLPWINAYLGTVEGDYTYYRSAGLRQLEYVMRKQGDEAMAKAFHDEAEKIYPGNRGTYIEDLAKP